MNAFLMIGQSNMSGRGSLTELPELRNEHVYVLRNRAWEIACEPVVRDRPFAGAGMGLAFGSTLALLTGDDVGLLPCSLGGSPLEQWMPGEPLFEEAVAQSACAMALGARLAGILWHQGETDSKDAEASFTYLKRLKLMMRALLERLREAAAATGLPNAIAEPMPVIVGELGDYLDMSAPSKYHRVINEQLHTFASEHASRACVAARDLPDKGDRLHFSALSQRRLGVRYASAWADIMARMNAGAAGQNLIQARYD